MSKIGRQPLPIPTGVNIITAENFITIEGTKGNLSLHIKHTMIDIVNKKIIVIPISINTKNGYKKFHGLYRSLINNMITGVTLGYHKELMLKGVGYKANKEKNNIILSLGFSHTVNIKIPNNITVEILNQNKNVKILGINKCSVGLFAAQIRRIKPLEPYLGRGIRYIDETIKKKIGKTNSK